MSFLRLWNQNSRADSLLFPLLAAFVYQHSSVVKSGSAMWQRSSRQFSTESELYNCALRALMRRAHSIHEMREYLGRRAEDKSQIDPVVARLREQNYLDDDRYARDYARHHVQSRRQGRFRIARELRARGVPDRHIEAALDSVFSEADEAALARTRIQRALARVKAPLDQRKTASLYRSLLRAGFSADVIRAELRRAARTEVPGDGSPDDDSA
jgi:regulatory protein